MLRRRTTPKVVMLPNSTTFTARYQRISRKELPINIHVKKTRRIGLRNGSKSKMGPGLTIPARKRVRFRTSSATQDGVCRIKKNIEE